MNLPAHPASAPPTRRPSKPPWLKIRLSTAESWTKTAKIVRENNLHTVCEEAQCPNLSDCWSRGTATVMLLGDICTRSCGFCAVATGRPDAPDPDEPASVARAVEQMNLRHVVITSVNRDDLADGGAGVWAQTIFAIREKCPQTSIEVLVPDFKGVWADLKTVLDAKPDILNHNMETVRRITKPVRRQARYDRSLEMLLKAHEYGAKTKTGFMLGLGETHEEIKDAIREVFESAHVSILTLGQYLQPSPKHLPVHEYVHPDRFKELKDFSLSLGFRHVESGPLVRSSYHADEQVSSVLSSS